MRSLAYTKRSVRSVLAGALLLIGAGGWPGFRVKRPPVPAQRHLVEIRDFAFEPAQVIAAPGDTIVWVNRDVVPHTVTGSDAPWDSGTLREAESWYLVVEEAGHHAYYCRLHPAMKGGFLVK